MSRVSTSNTGRSSSSTSRPWPRPAATAWYNQTLCRVNDSVVRLGVIRGEYHWHKHETDDEFFFVIDGRLFVDLEGRSFELRPRQGLVVPRGTTHRTRAPERTVILMVENAGIVPTGDEAQAEGERS